MKTLYRNIKVLALFIMWTYLISEGLMVLWELYPMLTMTITFSIFVISVYYLVCAYLKSIEITEDEVIGR